MEVGSTAPGMGPQTYSLKKANEIQEQAVSALLEGAKSQSTQPQKSGAPELTGIGQNLDIKA